MFDHFQFALILGPNIPGSYVILLFTSSNLASITSPIHNWVLFLLWFHPSFFLELFLHWSPVAYCAPTDLRSSSVSVLSFCLFMLFMGFSRQESWSGLPFPSPVDLTLADVSDSKSICLECRSLGFNPWVRKIPWRRKWQPTPVLLPGKFHGWRSPMGCSPWGHKESDTNEQLHFLQWTTFYQTSPPWLINLAWPHTAWLSFIELDKAVAHVIRLASCLWLWFQSVCPLSEPTVLMP